MRGSNHQLFRPRLTMDTAVRDSPHCCTAALPHPMKGSAKLLPSLAAGLLTGLLAIVIASSCAALIFSGPLSAHVGSGIAAALLCTFVVGVIGALASSYAGTIATVQTEPVAILAVTAAAIADAMPANAPAEATFSTVMAAIVLASLLTGLFLAMLGIFQLGAFIRFIPYPVIGGFMAGIGWLLVTGSVAVMTDVSVELSNLGTLVRPGTLALWIPGLVLAVTMLLAQRWAPHPLEIPTILLAGVGLFYLVSFGADVLQGAPLGDRWFLDEPPRARISELLSVGTLHHVNWAIISEHVGGLGAAGLISLVSLLLNASALELAAEEDIDLDRELRTVGAANVVSGFGGGMIGYHSLSLSRLALQIGVRNRLVGLVTAAVCLISLYAGTSVLSAVPKPILGGLLMFLGLGFLMEWVYDARKRLPGADYAVVLLILLAVGSIGYLPGLGIGIVAAVILFVVNYSRISLIKQAVPGSLHQSNVDRPRQHVQHLREHGDEIYILKLQGFIFFGSANNLLNRIRERALDGGSRQLRFVVFDFRRVTGLDASAVIGFTKIQQLAARLEFRLVFVALPAELAQQFEGSGFTLSDAATSKRFPDLDHGLEWCEDQLLTAARLGEPATAAMPWDHTFPAPMRERVRRYVERVDVQRGKHLIRQGEQANDLYFIESGQFSVSLEVHDGQTVRLRKIGPGTVLGELGLYLGATRSASVVADEASTVYRLRGSALRQMKETDPELASAFHEYMARLLAERLLHTNKILEAILD
jgi:SulP family sulfate permease